MKYITPDINNNPQRMQKFDKLIHLGVITGAHGIKGDVVIHSFTAPSTNIVNLTLCNASGDEILLKFLRKKSDNLVICSVSGITTRTAADLLRGTKIYTLRSNLPHLLESEYYVEDMKGLEVRNLDGKTIGTIVAIHNFGAGDIVEIDFNDATNAMYPFTSEIFLEVSKDYIVFADAIILDS